MKLELRHYETVVALIENPSMTMAARQLSVTQSALSHRLAEAERRLGVALFSRGPDRRLAPTLQGQAVHQAASRALAELRRIEEALTVAPPDVEVTLRIGVSGYEAFHWYPDFLGALRAERPEIELDLVVVGDHASEALYERSADIVLALGDPSGEVELTDLFDDELVLVTEPGHALARRPFIEAADLVDETMLTYNPFPSPGFEYNRFVAPSGYAPRIVRVVPQVSAIVELVAAGTGVAILSRWATAAMVSAGRLATARCGVAGLSIPWRAVTRRGDPLAAEVTGLLARHFDADGS